MQHARIRRLDPTSGTGLPAGQKRSGFGSSLLI